MRAPLIVGALLLSGCRKPPPLENHYYSLVLEAADSRTKTEGGLPEAQLDVVEVVLPEFLMSRSLVMQVNSNEVRHAKYHHWGEPLEVSTRQVLAQDLGDAIPALNVAPGTGRGADCTLRVHFDRFHPTSDARVVVSGRFVFTQGENTVRRAFDVSQVQHGDGYTRAVKGMRQAVQALSTELRPVVSRCVPRSSE